MQNLGNNIELYIGSQIEYESERIALRQIVETINSDCLSAVIIANINLSGRQIDIIVATETTVLVVEAKGFTRPIRGSENGSWEYKSATGEWKTTGRNYYQQTLDAKNAFRDSMRFYLGNNVNYPDAALVFVPSIPEGSEILSGDFKVNVGDSCLLQSFDAYNKNSNCSLSQLCAFAEHHNLIKIDFLEAASDKQLADDERLLDLYKKSFLETYEPQVQGLIPFLCRVGEDVVISSEVENQGVGGKDMLIVGPSGCGKSMLAKKIGLRCIENLSIPVIIEAKYFQKEFSALLNQEAALLDVPSINALFAASKRFSKPLRIILDGYNECPQTLRHRLFRCLRATALRNRAGIVVTSQEVDEELEQLNLQITCVPEPDLKVKKAIANLAGDEEKSSKIEELLDLVKSGLEADIIGQLSKTLIPGVSRYALFDTYIRKRLGDIAQEGIRILTHVGNYLSENVTFSMSVRDFDRLLEMNDLPLAVSRRLLSTNLLVERGDRISFGHELYLNAFSAEAVLRACGNDVDSIKSAITAPKNANYKTLIIGAIDNTNLLDNVLMGIDDAEIIISCVTGECVEYARQWAEQGFNNVLLHIKQEAQSVRFTFDEKVWMGISADPKSLYSWTKGEQAFVNALPQLLRKGKYIDEVFEIAGIMDENLQNSFDSLVEEARKKNINLRSTLFSIGLNDQNSSISISKIIAWIDIASFSERKKDAEVISKWIENKLANDGIANGQLFMLLKLGRRVWKNNIFASVLPKFIRERLRYAPSCLCLALLDTARSCGCGNATDDERNQIIEALNEIDTKNIWTSTAIIEALKTLGGMEEVEYEETVKTEIEQVFNDPENSEHWSLARSIYDRQFDHPYDGVYWEVIHELPDLKRKEFLTLAVRAKKNEFRMFISCLITELEIFGDKDTAKYIEHWTELPPKDDPMSQDSIGAYVVAHIVLGRLEYPLPPKTYSGSKEENAMMACGEIYYWSNRADLNWDDRKKCCEQAWNVLLMHELDVSLGVLKECEDAIRHEQVKSTIFDMFSEEVSEICRQTFLRNETQCSRSRWVKHKEILSYAISVLGLCGKATDLTLLRSMADHQYYGNTAIRAVQRLESKCSI